jgi:hypothetical protein
MERPWSRFFQASDRSEGKMLMPDLARLTLRLAYLSKIKATGISRSSYRFGLATADVNRQPTSRFCPLPLLWNFLTGFESPLLPNTATDECFALRSGSR